MIRDRQHGPVIELNRIQVKRSRSKGGLAGPEGTKSVFGQVCCKLSHFGSDSLLLPHRVWKVKFIGKLTEQDLLLFLKKFIFSLQFRFVLSLVLIFCKQVDNFEYICLSHYLAVVLFSLF